MSAARPVPHPSTWSRGYWDAAQNRQFVIQECHACNKVIMYPKRVCPHCLSDDLGWRASSGQGEIYAVTVQLAGAPSGFEDRLPFVLAVVRLDEGVQLMSNVVGEGASKAKIGDRVRVDFDVVGDATLPVFRLDRDAQA